MTAAQPASVWLLLQITSSTLWTHWSWKYSYFQSLISHHKVTQELLFHLLWLTGGREHILLTSLCMCFCRQVCCPGTDCAIVFVNRHLSFDSSDNTKHTWKWCTADQNQTALLGDLKRDALCKMPAICHAVSGSKTGLESCRRAL